MEEGGRKRGCVIIGMGVCFCVCFLCNRKKKLKKMNEDCVEGG